MAILDMTQMKDVNVQPLYDTVLYPTAGSTQLVFFQFGRGTGVSCFQTAAGVLPKSYADTNLDLGGQLPSGYYFRLLAFRVMPSFDITDADLHTVLNGLFFEFRKADKVFIRVPLRTIPQGNGPMGSGASMNSSGWPALSNNYSVGKKPLDIGPSENFQVTLTHGAGQLHPCTTADAAVGGHLAGLPLTVFLDGFLYRPIQ